MADFTLTRVAKYPETTVVKAYAASNWPDHVINPTGSPLGAAADTQTMTNGTLTFTGLTKGARYFAHASVGGEDTYLAFTAGEDAAEGTSVANTGEDETITGAWTFDTIPALPADTVETADIQDGAVTAVKVAADVATQAELDTHEADTTAVHGITDTSVLAVDNADNSFSTKQTFQGEVEIDGDLNHDGTNVGFYGVAPVARSGGWTITNDATDRAFDANSTTLDEIADALATLIRDVAATGLVGAVS